MVGMGTSGEYQYITISRKTWKWLEFMGFVCPSPGLGQNGG